MADDGHYDLIKEAAVANAEKSKSRNVQVSHLFEILLRQPEVGRIFEQLGLSPKLLQKEAVRTSREHQNTKQIDVPSVVGSDLKRIYENAEFKANQDQRAPDAVDLLASAVTNDSKTSSYFAREHSLEHKKIVQACIQYHELEEKLGPCDPRLKNCPTLRMFSTNLVAKAAAGEIDEAIGRASEMKRAMRVLGRRLKNNVIFVGPAGVGKTALVEGLAWNIAKGKVPQRLKNKIILSIDLAAMVAGTKFRGEFEERLLKVMNEVKSLGRDVILHIPEFHNIMGAGSAEGALDASNILRPALGRGELQIIGDTTFEDFRKHVEKDASMERRCEGVRVDEPVIGDALKMVENRAGGLEKFHGVKIDREVVHYAVQRAKRHMHKVKLPDSAITLLDDAGSMANLDGKKRITINDIDTILLTDHSVAPTAIGTDENTHLVNLEPSLSERVIGQDEAISAIAKSVRRARVFKKPNKPIGTYILLGPTGVGKTESALTLAEVMGLTLKRFDMSEFMDKEAAGRFIGSNKGYVGYEEGGELINHANDYPNSLYLLDEIEKAHPDILNLLLQITDNGTITDGKGRVGRFGNSIIIMTSNLGAADAIAQESKTQLGFGPVTSEDPEAAFKAGVLKAFEAHFKSELRNRISEVLIYNRLKMADMIEIGDKFLKLTHTKLGERSVTMELDMAAKKWLVDAGFDKKMGARPMERMIEKSIEDRLTDDLLSGKLAPGSHVTITVKGGKLDFTTTSPAAGLDQEPQAVRPASTPAIRELAAATA